MREQWFSGFKHWILEILLVFLSFLVFSYQILAFSIFCCYVFDVKYGIHLYDRTAKIMQQNFQNIGPGF